MEEIDLNKVLDEALTEHGIDDSVTVVSLKRAAAQLLRECIGYWLSKRNEDETH